MSRRAWALPLALSLLACTATPGTRPASGARPAASKASPSPRASASPRVAAASPAPMAAEASPSPAPTPWPGLQRPSGPSEELSGTLLLSREALSAFGQGELAGGAWQMPRRNPSQAAHPIPPPTLVGSTGALRPAVKALLDGQAEAELARTGLLSNHGSGLISDQGGGLISDQGGGLVSNHGSGWRLLQAEAAASSAPLPVAGLAVAALDLRTGRALPVGARPDGSPAYEALTDAQGRYALHLPPKSRGHAMIVSALRPQQADPTGSLGALAQLGQGEAGLSPSSSQLFRMIRRLASSRIERMLAAPSEAALDAYLTRMFSAMRGGELIKPVYAPIFLKLHAAAQEGRVGELSPAQRAALALRVADQGMNGLDFDALELDEAQDPFWFGPKVRLGPALMESLIALRAAFNAERLRRPGPMTALDLPARVVVDESGLPRGWQASAEAQGLMKADFPLRHSDDLDVVLAHGVMRNADPYHIGTAIYGRILSAYGVQDHSEADAALYLARFGLPLENGDRFRQLAFQALMAIFNNLLQDPDPDGDGLGVQAAALQVTRAGAASLPQAEAPASAP